MVADHPATRPPRNKTTHFPRVGIASYEDAQGLHASRPKISTRQALVRASTGRFTEALSSPQSNDLKGLPTFNRDVDDLNPSILDLTLAGLDAAAANASGGHGSRISRMRRDC